jgi:hypothetical protein
MGTRGKKERKLEGKEKGNSKVKEEEREKGQGQINKESNRKQNMGKMEITENKTKTEKYGNGMEGKGKGRE